MSKAFKSVGKIVKKIAKPLKKIAPIALAIAAPYALAALPGAAGAFFGSGILGPAVGAGLGSFGGTLISGGSFSDALKSGIMAGGIAGVGGAIFGGGGLPKFGGPKGMGSPIAGGKGALTGGLGQVPTPGVGIAKTLTGYQPGVSAMMGPQTRGVFAGKVPTSVFQAPKAVSGLQNLKNIASKFNPAKILTGAKGFIESKPKTAAGLALGAGALLGSAGMKQQAIPDVDMEGIRTGKSARDIMKANPFKHWIQNLTWQDPQGVTQGVKYVGGIPQFGVKEGGIIQAKDGGLLNGPGTGTSDSIKGHIEGDGGVKQPVRLSDGEFVIKANAVKNLGGGSVRNGAKKLYALQKQWDNMAVA